MKLELNLVMNQGIYSPVFRILDRKRVENYESTYVMKLIAEFIRGNDAILNNWLSDKDLVNRLSNVTDDMTVTEFMSIKYLLAEAGLDILVYTVADMEVNDTDIPVGEFEFNVVDDYSVSESFIKNSTKISLKEENYYELYARIQDMYSFFELGSLAGYSNNPLRKSLDALKITAESMGVTPISLTNEINSTLEYLGKKLILITND